MKMTTPQEAVPLHAALVLAILKEQNMLDITGWCGWIYSIEYLDVTLALILKNN